MQKARAKAALPRNAKTVCMPSQELCSTGLNGFISRGNKVDSSIRINTTGIMKEERRTILYRTCRAKKIRTMHHAKNDVAS
jgi:hypothetical protein